MTGNKDDVVVGVTFWLWQGLLFVLVAALFFIVGKLLMTPATGPKKNTIKCLRNSTLYGDLPNLLIIERWGEREIENSCWALTEYPLFECFGPRNLLTLLGAGLHPPIRRVSRQVKMNFTEQWFKASFFLPCEFESWVLAYDASLLFSRVVGEGLILRNLPNSTKLCKGSVIFSWLYRLPPRPWLCARCTPEPLVHHPFELMSWHNGCQTCTW